MHYALCTIRYSLYTMHCALCTIHYTLYTIRYSLCTMYCVLCIVHYALCTMPGRSLSFTPICSSYHSFDVLSLFFFELGPTCPFFFLFLVRFNPKTIYFLLVSISFILIKYSLSICHFSEFFKNPVFRFHSTFVA